MGRSFMAVIVGFLAMSGFASIAFIAAFVLMGEDKVFLRGTYDVSVSWAGVSAFMGLLAALVGGATCGGIGLRSAPIWVLAGVTLVFGAVYAWLSLAEGSAARLGEAGILESQFFSRSPTWLLLASPILDVVGISVAGVLAMHGSKRRVTPRPFAPTTT